MKAKFKFEILKESWNFNTMFQISHAPWSYNKTRANSHRACFL